jgi:hypothetical protein
MNGNSYRLNPIGKSLASIENEFSMREYPLLNSGRAEFDELAQDPVAQEKLCWWFEGF